MAIVQKQVDVAKELGDVVDVLVSLVQGIKAHKSLSELVSLEFQKVVDAVSGIDQVGAELAANKKACENTFALGSVDLLDALLAPSAPPAP